MFRPWRHLKVSAKAYAVDPASVGMARNPTPTIPTVNRVAANLPASGRRASAAWRVVSMCVMPWRLRVIAVVRMMKNMTTFEKNAPTPTSKFLSSSSLSVAPFRLASVLCPAAFSSSTSSLACQKNKYGLIVVPRIATSVDHSSLVWGMDGTKVARATLIQSAPTTNASAVSDAPYMEWQVDFWRRAGRVRYSCLKEAAGEEASMQIQWCCRDEKDSGNR